MKNQSYVPKGDLKKNTLGGIKWGVIDKGANVLIQFIVGVILARLLPPEDFGLIGLAMIVIGFSQIAVDLGLGPALIQRKEITERHVRSCFTISGLLGVLITVIVFSSAPLIADLLGTDEVTPVVKALSFIFIFNGLEIPGFSLLRKALDFRKIFIVNSIKIAIYGVITIILALNGWGVWSLVVGHLIRSFLSLMITYAFVRHSVIPFLGRQELKELSYFGTGMTINKVFNYFALRGDFFMVGRLLGPSQLGIYTIAYNLMQMPTNQFVSVLSEVLFPATSVIQDDKEKTRRFFIKSIQLVSFIVAPICLVIVVLSPEIIVGVYGDQWKEAILPLQILGLVGFLRATYNIGGAFLRAKGWVYKLFLSNVVYGASVLIGVWVGAKFWELQGAAVAVCVSIVLVWICIMYFNSKAIGLSIKQVLNAYVPGLLLGVGVMIIVIVVKGILTMYINSHIIVLITCIFMTLLSSLLLMKILPDRFLSNIPSQLRALVEDSKLSYRYKQTILKLIS